MALKSKVFFQRVNGRLLLLPSLVCVNIYWQYILVNYCVEWLHCECDCVWSHSQQPGVMLQI